LGIGTGCLEPGGEVLLANTAEIERLRRFAVPLHGREQLADTAIVDAVAIAEELRKRQARSADLFQNELLLGRGREAAKFADEFAHSAQLVTMILIAGNVGSHQPPEAGLVVPMRRCWMMRSPFGPSRIRRPVIDGALTPPHDGEG